MTTLTQAVRLLGLKESDSVHLVLCPGSGMCSGMCDCVCMTVRAMRHYLKMNKVFVTRIDPYHFKYGGEEYGGEGYSISWEFTISTGTASSTRSLIFWLVHRYGLYICGDESKKFAKTRRSTKIF